jgi:hypothetical protein
MVAGDICSVRRGELSTWQCTHAWLQYSPMLICRMVVGACDSGAMSLAACQAKQYAR